MQGPLLELRLEDYESPSWVLTLAFGLPASLYILSCILLPHIIPAWVPHRVTLITGLFFYAVSLSLIGPFFEPMNLTAMLVGLSLTSFFSSF